MGEGVSSDLVPGGQLRPDEFGVLRRLRSDHEEGGRHVVARGGPRGCAGSTSGRARRRRSAPRSCRAAAPIGVAGRTGRAPGPAFPTPGPNRADAPVDDRADRLAGEPVEGEGQRQRQHHGDEGQPAGPGKREGRAAFGRGDAMSAPGVVVVCVLPRARCLPGGPAAVRALRRDGALAGSGRLVVGGVVGAVVTGVVVASGLSPGVLVLVVVEVVVVVPDPDGCPVGADSRAGATTEGDVESPGVPVPLSLPGAGRRPDDGADRASPTEAPAVETLISRAEGLRAACSPRTIGADGIMRPSSGPMVGRLSGPRRGSRAKPITSRPMYAVRQTSSTRRRGRSRRGGARCRRRRPALARGFRRLRLVPRCCGPPGRAR